jgi:chromosome segregation ATPase
VKRQRQDLIKLREHDLELSNEVEFLRARLDRISTERDRATEAVQTAREKDLEAKLHEREKKIEDLRAKVNSLQDAQSRFGLSF